MLEQNRNGTLILSESLVCPRCRELLTRSSTGSLRCTAPGCALTGVEFPTANEQPVLIDFQKSIFLPEAYLKGNGSVFRRDDSGRSLSVRARNFVWGGKNAVAPRIAAELVARLRHLRPRPTLLIVGGGAISSGTGALHDGSIEVVAMDVYASSNTSFVADGHAIPLPEGSVDAVWIQAVLEHVLDPGTVVGEIHRVLKLGGFVYADTPFLQQVHEGAYDFTRFTLSGHRWLFRNFEEIESGAVGGAGTALVQSIRYAFRSLLLSDKIATLMTAPFFWLRFLDALTWRRANADAASGVYFFGKKSLESIAPIDMVNYYEAQSRGSTRLKSARGRLVSAFWHAYILISPLGGKRVAVDVKNLNVFSSDYVKDGNPSFQGNDSTSDRMKSFYSLGL